MFTECNTIGDDTTFIPHTADLRQSRYPLVLTQPRLRFRGEKAETPERNAVFGQPCVTPRPPCAPPMTGRGGGGGGHEVTVPPPPRGGGERGIVPHNGSTKSAAVPT